MYRLFVTDLPPGCNEDKLFRSFADKFGSAKKADIVKNDDKSSRGFGFIIFDDKADLDAALKQEIWIDGSRLKTDVAHQRTYDSNHRSDRFRNNRNYHTKNHYHSHHNNHNNQQQHQHQNQHHHHQHPHHHQNQNHGGVLNHQNLNSHRGLSSNSHVSNPSQPNPSVSQHKSIQGPLSVQTQRTHQSRTGTNTNNSSLASSAISPSAGDSATANPSRPHGSVTPVSAANSASSTANGVMHPMPYIDPYGLIYDPMTGVPYTMGPSPIVTTDMSAISNHPPSSMSGGSASSSEITGETQGIPPPPANIYYHHGAPSAPTIRYGLPGSGVGPPVMPQISQPNSAIQGPPVSRYNLTRSPAGDLNGTGQAHPPQPFYYMNYWGGPPIYFDTGAQPGLYPQPFFVVRRMPFNPPGQNPFPS